MNIWSNKVRYLNVFLILLYINAIMSVQTYDKYDIGYGIY